MYSNYIYIYIQIALSIFICLFLLSLISHLLSTTRSSNLPFILVASHVQLFYLCPSSRLLISVVYPSASLSFFGSHLMFGFIFASCVLCIVCLFSSSVIDGFWLSLAARFFLFFFFCLFFFVTGQVHRAQTRVNMA